MGSERPSDPSGTPGRDRLVTAVVTLACVVAIAISAAAMTSTLETEPDEAVDLDFELLPVGESQAVAVKDEIESGSASRGAADTAGSGSAERQSRRQVGESESGDASRQRDRDETASERTTETGTGEIPSRLDPLGRLLALLKRLLPILVGLAIVTGLAVRYREELLAIARARFGDYEPVRGGPPPTRRDPSPSDEVEQAWVSLLRRADVDRPWRYTPGECAAAAIDRGYDRESVARLRRLFEEVRYGDRRVTDSRVRQARQHLDALGLEDRQ